jgi:hypothetical protein
MFDCVNLMSRFGTQYKIDWDECYDPANRPKENLDPWHMTIPCERGTITPYGDSKLSVMVDYRPITAKRLSELGVCKLYQDGDHEKTFLFDVADFDTVAEIVKPRRKRQVSEQERQRLATMSAKHGFQKHQSERSRGSQDAIGGDSLTDYPSSPSKSILSADNANDYQKPQWSKTE